MTMLEKLKILTSLQKSPKNVGDLGQLIVATGFEKLPKVQSGHTDNSCSSSSSSEECILLGQENEIM